MFDTELEMSLRFEEFLQNNFGDSYIKEFQGLFWVPDYVYYNKHKNNTAIISFELKLKNWKQAVKQAFRYKSFSNASYVVLPMHIIELAKNNIEVFKRYNIWLILFSSTWEIEILFKPEAWMPYSLNLSNKLISWVVFTNKKTKNIETLFSCSTYSNDSICLHK